MALGAAGSAALFVRTSGGPSLLLPWVVLFLYARHQVLAVRAARGELAAVVAGAEPEGEAEGSAWLSGRVASLRHLARAFAHARRGDSLSSDMALSRVEREDLGAWEARVLEAVRALGCLDRCDTTRAAQLVPLALPTGNEAIDQQLARVLVRAAWDDEQRLRAIEGAMISGGRSLRSIALLCRIRQTSLVEGEASRAPLSRRVALRVADEARAIGDAELADELVSSIERRGVYR